MDVDMDVDMDELIGFDNDLQEVVPGEFITSSPNTKSRSPSTFLAAPSRYSHSLLATSLNDFAK